MTEYTILAVDDTPANLTLLYNVLTQAGYRVRAAPSGKLALKTIAVSLPDLILLDIRMPELNGYEVCSVLKSDPHTADIPIIFLSALNEVEDKVKAFKVGAVDYVTKPFYHEEVLARVNTQIRLIEEKRKVQLLQQKERRHFEELMRIKDEFVATVSHDFRSPLSVIQGNASLLERYRNKPEHEQLEMIKIIINTTRQLNNMVSNLLDLSRLESGGMLPFESVNVIGFIVTLKKELSPFAEQQEVNLTFHCEAFDADTNFYIDEPLLRQAFVNLISNAIKFTHNNGYVDIHVVNDENTIVFEIRDTGIGIPENDLPHIFERFYKVGSIEHQDLRGSGLGLALVQSIIEKHDGHIQVDSRLGEGTVFTVRLPIAEHF